MENFIEHPLIVFLMNHPLIVFASSFLVMWLSTLVGTLFLRRRLALKPETREDFGVIQAATLTLLGLIIGFTFSMATSRYDQRENYEEEEANAIGTEYLRADLLPPANAVKVRALLRDYLDQRVQFYSTRDVKQIQQIKTRTAQLQADLWAAVLATPAPTPTAALAISGMNDVLNSEGYTQAAWRNRIPKSAWILMWAIAISCNLLIGYGANGAKANNVLLLILPLVASIAFFLIADIDSPRSGLVRVKPQNLISLAESLRAQ